MKKLLIIISIIIAFNNVQSQDKVKFKLTAEASPLLFYKFDNSATDYHINNYNYSYGVLGAFYFGRKQMNINFSINSGIRLRTKKFHSYYLRNNASELDAFTINEFQYLMIPILFGCHYSITGDYSLNSLFGINLAKITHTSYSSFDEKGVSNKVDPSLTYSNLNELYLQVTIEKLIADRNISVSIGPFIYYKYKDDFVYSDSYFNLGRFSFGFSIGFSFIHFKK